MIDMKMIFNSRAKKLTLPRFEIESLWNSEKAYRSLFRVNEIVVVRMRGQ